MGFEETARKSVEANRALSKRNKMILRKHNADPKYGDLSYMESDDMPEVSLAEQLVVREKHKREQAEEKRIDRIFMGIGLLFLIAIFWSWV